MKSSLVNGGVLICVAAMMLAGCSGSQSYLGPSLLRQDALHVGGFAITHRETLNGDGSDGRVSGKAYGPYPGTFTDYVMMSGNCRQEGDFSGKFTITSGANTVTGSYQGHGVVRCSRGAMFIYSALTYTAKFEPGGRTISGKGLGDMGESPLFGVTIAVHMRSF